MELLYMDPKLREKTKAVFRSVLKKCEKQNKTDTPEEDELGHPDNSHPKTRRFDLPKNTNHN